MPAQPAFAYLGVSADSERLSCPETGGFKVSYVAAHQIFLFQINFERRFNLLAVNAKFSAVRFKHPTAEPSEKKKKKKKKIFAQG